MGLNFSEEDFRSISATIVEAMAGKSTLYGTEEGIAELIRERNDLKAECASLSTQVELVGTSCEA